MAGKRIPRTELKAGMKLQSEQDFKNVGKVRTVELKQLDNERPGNWICISRWEGSEQERNVSIAASRLEHPSHFKPVTE